MSQHWQNIIKDAQDLRHQLHQAPELSWHEERTAETIRAGLNALDIPWRVCAGTGTVATLAQNKSSRRGFPTIALRGDIDALPIKEESGKAYSSQTDGCMHACGHDGHTAVLLAAAQWLKRHEEALPAPVSLIFQPAEEGGHGAREMIKEGALDGIDEIYGWHNWPAVPFAKLICPDGIVMCGNGTFSVDITGVGGHASQPELCRDPVLAAGAMVSALQQIVSRRIAPQQATVVSVTSIDAPSGPTVIPQNAKIGGCIRVPNRSIRDDINAQIKHICENVAAAYGVTCTVNIQPRYDATINHPAQADKMRKHWLVDHAEGLDASAALPIMGSEDFSYYLKEIPGAFALIGADDGDGHHFPCHSPHYDFNDRLIPLVTALYSRLVGAPVPNRST